MHIIVDLVISADEYIKQYRTPLAVVSTRSRDGRTVSFPANILQPYALHNGIQGSFRVDFDSSGKFKSIDRIDARSL